MSKACKLVTQKNLPRISEFPLFQRVPLRILDSGCLSPQYLANGSTGELN